jgi:hypothetical protein
VKQFIGAYSSRKRWSTHPNRNALPHGFVGCDGHILDSRDPFQVGGQGSAGGVFFKQVELGQRAQVIDVSQRRVVEVEVGGEPPQEVRAEGRRNSRRYRRDVSAGYGRRYSGLGDADVADAQAFRKNAVGAGEGNGMGLSDGKAVLRGIGDREVVFVTVRN